MVHLPFKVGPGGFEVGVVRVVLNEIKFSLQFLQDAFLGLSIMRDEKQFALDAHLRSRIHVKFKFLIMADAQGLHGQLGLDPHLGQIAHQHRQLIGYLFYQ